MNQESKKARVLSILMEHALVKSKQMFKLDNALNDFNLVESEISHKTRWDLVEYLNDKCFLSKLVLLVDYLAERPTCEETIVNCFVWKHTRHKAFHRGHGVENVCLPKTRMDFIEQTALDSVKHSIKDKLITQVLDSSIDECKNPTFLHDIFYSAISNAVKYHGESST